ncbi:DNA topoisomerase 3-alpha-like isoform X2 [Sycon ciliatum]
MAQAVEARQELDFRIGCAFTRFQTMHLKRVFAGTLGHQKVISYGPCQFPTLGFVVDRYKQVQAFIPEGFFKLKVTYETEGGRMEFAWKRFRVFHRLPAEIILGLCQEQPTAKVTSVRGSNTTKYRPVALDTVEFEKLASRKLRINAKEAMRVAEKLYTSGFISYPRTETNIFPKSLNLTPLVEMQTQDHQWGEFAQRILNVYGGPNARNGRKSDNAHPPIHPTKFTNTLAGNEKTVYEFVVRHFLACVSKDAQGHETNVEIEIAEEKFTAKGLEILQRHFLDVYPYERWSDRIMPQHFEVNDTFQPTSIDLIEGETSAPPLLKEADLIALMDKHGIGTDATHAEHIETIKNRLYVGVQPDGSFVPGELGMGLVDGYDSMGFQMSKPDLRAELESDLKSICERRKQKNDVVRDMLQRYRHVFEQALAQKNLLENALSVYFGDPTNQPPPPGGGGPGGPGGGGGGGFDGGGGGGGGGLHPNPNAGEPAGPCPQCGVGQMCIREKKAGGFMIGCNCYPGCRASIFFPEIVTGLTAAKKKCDQCKPPGAVFKVKVKFKRGGAPTGLKQGYEGCYRGCDAMFASALKLTDRMRNLSRSRPATTGGAASSVSAGSRPPAPAQSLASSTAAANTHSANSREHPRSSNVSGGTFSSSSSATRGGGGSGGAGGGSHVSSSAAGRSAQGASAAGSGAQRHISAFSNDNQSHVFDHGAATTSSHHSMTSSSHHSYSAGHHQSSARPAQSSSSNGAYNPPSHNPYSSTTAAGGQHSLSSTARGQQGESNQSNSFGGDGFEGLDEEMLLEGIGDFGDDGTTSTGAGEAPVVLCRCEQRAVVKTVRKEGPNQGREFYGCPKPYKEGCDFFQWADDTATSGGGGGGFGGGGGGRGNGTGTSYESRRSSDGVSGYSNQAGGGGSGGGDGGGTVRCNCDLACAQYAVRKEGPNQGRLFYKCGKAQRESQCSFFKWVDEVTTDGASSTSNSAATSAGGFGSSSTRGWGGGGGGGGGQTNTSSGYNSAPGMLGAPGRGQKRAYAMQSSTGDDGYAGAGGGAGTGAGAGTAKKRKPPACSVCRKPGHTKRSCPMVKQYS